MCPICGRTTASCAVYGPAEYVNGPSATLPLVQGHTKYLCKHCGHFFLPWAGTDLEDTRAMYRGIYAGDVGKTENKRAAFQLNLIRYVIGHLGTQANPVVLDFGCGPNTSPAQRMREAGYDVRCCDILDAGPADAAVFFQYDPADSRWNGRFDAIVSVDVIEHLGDTLEAWRALNRLLRPGGIMAHCFPSRIHYSLRHKCWATPFHACGFSRKSLEMLARKTGFEWETTEPFPADVPFVFRFRKTRDV